MAEYLILLGVGTLAGVINVVAGGGSMLTVPALIFLGLPPTVANGTNRIAIVTQNVGAVWGFHRQGLIERGWLKLAAPPAVAGALLGTWIATVVDDASFQRALAIVMILIAGYTVWDPLKGKDLTGKANFEDHALGKVGVGAAFFLLGVYGGFIQIGVGFFVLALAMSAGLDLVRGNALKAMLVLVYTVPALALFGAAGKVHWQMGTVLALGNFTGALLGVRLAHVLRELLQRALDKRNFVLFILENLI